MKSIYFVMGMLLHQLACFGQVDSPVELKVDNLPSQGLVLNQGWKFHPGDDIEWSKPGFDDSRWQAINPLLDLYYLPQIRQTSIGWFRLRFKVADSLLQKPLALQVDQHIASEIFLNGKLLHTYGRVSADVNQVQAYQPNFAPVGVVFEQAEQVLAVRFSVQEHLPYFYFYPNYKTVEIRLNEIPKAHAFEKYITRFQKYNLFEAGLFILMGLVFLGVYLVYDQQKANLYFALANFSVGIGNILYINTVTSSELAYRTYAAVASWLLMWVFYNLFLYLAIYSLFETRKGMPFWIVIGLYFLGMSTLFYIYQYTWIVGMSIAFSIYILELLRICILAYRKGRRGVSIVIVGLITYLITLNVFNFMYYGLLPNLVFTENYGLIDIDYHIYIMCIPVTLSIYLGREYAFTGKDLEQKLVEVQKLSEKTISQEKEKQQLLATENERLEQQVAERTWELKHQKEELQSTVEHLKATQNQLIQSEKMASLGELTAGIAHEIQNPLNFVNNFSEISNELVEELRSGPFEKLPETDKEEGQAILADLSQNLEKIHHHGKRADSIVKSMLQHSRTSSGERLLTDINALVDEYLRLAYHGLRAKEKDFNADFTLEPDPSLGKIEVVPQEIGRVLLNLFNNAFYATAQKKARLNGQYQPQVLVSTKALSNTIEIHVRDNGIGIPKSVKHKIFQPFFTTKPTGEGTGLGLSLSYDIITKGHNGELKVDSKEGEYSEFLVTLPTG